MCGYVHPLPATDTWWQPPHVRSASRRYTSYWNAFLFDIALGDFTNGHEHELMKILQWWSGTLQSREIADIFEKLDISFGCRSQVRIVCVWGGGGGRMMHVVIRKGKLAITGRNEVVAKVMFLQVCVCPRGGGGCLPQCILGCQTRPPPAPPRSGRPPRDQADPPPPPGSIQHTVYERPVRILLECILVQIWVFIQS